MQLKFIILQVLYIVKVGNKEYFIMITTNDIDLHKDIETDLHFLQFEFDLKMGSINMQVLIYNQFFC